MKNQIGRQIGRLTCSRLIRINTSGEKIYEWQCTCGGLTIRSVGHAKQINHCGCLSYERKSKAMTKHGHCRDYSVTPAYTTWVGMIKRCTNPNSSGWRFYGAKGISVCTKWRHSFENFLADMGEPPSKNYSLDRFPDPYGNYEPGNCRWATRLEQSNNKINSRFIEYNGQKKTVAEWARTLGVRHHVLYNRFMSLKSGPKAIEYVQNQLRTCG